MALTRNFLKSMGLTDEQVNAIIENHVETVDGLKAERDSYKAKAETVATLTQERDDWKAKYEASGDAAKIQADFDAYKQQIADEKAAAQTDADVLALLKEAGIQRESFQQLASKSFDRSKIKRNEDGSISNRQELLEGIKTDFADCIATQQQQGTPPNNPPTGGGTPLTREQILAEKDTAKRQKLIAENISLFHT